jgi:hypothetical protein
VKDPVKRLAQRIRSEFVQDVPKDVAVCEFDCTETTCKSSDWVHCQRRRGITAGDADATGYSGDDKGG